MYSNKKIYETDKSLKGGGAAAHVAHTTREFWIT